MKKKNVSYFTMKKAGWNSSGVWWRGFGFIGGCAYSADGIFGGYSQKEIARILKNKMLSKANA